MPNAPPTCWVVLTRPDASPESSGATPDIARVISDGIVRPAPMPISTKAGKTLAKYEPSTPARLNQASPAAMRSSAGSSTVRGPKRVIRRAENPRVITPIVMEIGRNAAPVASASNPRTRWRYSADEEEHPSMPATASIWARFAPATSRERRMPSRSSGFDAVAWRTTNATSSTKATKPSAPGVRVDDRVDGEHQGRRHQHGARDVGARAPARGRSRAPADARPRRTRNTPIGTLTKKIQCQFSVSVSTPPSKQADRGARRADEPEDADRLRLLARLAGTS